MPKKKKDKRNKPGQFTSEVHRTKVESEAKGVLKSEKSIGQLVKEAQNDLIEQGKAIGRKEAEDVFARELKEAKLDAFASGQEAGIRVTGDLRFRRGVEEGKEQGYEAGYKRGFVCGQRGMAHGQFVAGMVIGSVVAILGGLLAVALVF